MSIVYIFFFSSHSPSASPQWHYMILETETLYHLWHLTTEMIKKHIEMKAGNGICEMIRNWAHLCLTVSVILFLGCIKMQHTDTHEMNPIQTWWTVQLCFMGSVPPLVKAHCSLKRNVIKVHPTLALELHLLVSTFLLSVRRLTPKPAYQSRP